MALFGSKKDAGDYLRTSEESVIATLNKKLAKEVKRREGAERGIKRWKQKCLALEEKMKDFTGMR